MRMSLEHLCVVPLLRLVARISLPGRTGRSARRRLCLTPFPEALEPRLVLAGGVTYTWIAAGDGTSFNDPNNWSHPGPYGSVGVPGVPTQGSNLDFPALATLPLNSPTTINFNSSFNSFPVNQLTIDDSYTFTGNGITVGSSIVVANPYFGKPTNTTLDLSNVTFARQAAIYTQRNSILTIGSSTDLTGVQLIMQGGLTTGGSGQVVIDTQSITDPQFGFTLQTFEVGGGTVTLGTTMDFSNSLFQVDTGASLQVADNAAVKVGSLSGSGTVDLEGTGAANDTTSLTAFTPAGESDQFTGSIDGAGALTMQGNGTLTLGGIDLSGDSGLDVVLGTLDVDGPITADTLNVGAGTFGGVGSWDFSGPVTFQSGSTFDVALNGLAAGTQSTQLISGDSTTGINLGNSTLTGTVNYQYQAGDQFTIATGPLVQGVFQNVVNGLVFLNGNILFAVTYSSTGVTLTAQQSLSTTQLSSSISPTHPGQPVTFTAAVSTRTMAVTSGTVTFMMGGTAMATEPVTAAGTASLTTTSLPLGSSAITAVFNGVSNILGSTSASLAQVVVPYSTITTVTSSMNPSRIGQAVTLTAIVTADGMAVTSGTVSFTRGNQRIGIATLGANGTATLTTTSLPQGNVRIQAAYTGNPDNFGSVSQGYIQVVARSATITTLTATTRVQPNGRVRQVLMAAVNVVGVIGLTPSGTVVFRRNGRVLGRARIVNGTATLVIPLRIPARGRFVASYQSTRRYRGSTSVPLVLPA
jgi:hypothetical protein